MKSTSWIELSKSALQNNIDFIKNELNNLEAFYSVVKGNAYGHGIREFCFLLYDLGVKNFSVFNAEEAYELVNVLRKKDISVMIMGSVTEDQMEWVILNEVSFFVFNWERLKNAISIAKRNNKKARIHLEFETGMNRTGFPLKELPQLYSFLKNDAPHLEVVGICSHLAGAESIGNYKRIQKQMRMFKKLHSITSSWSIDSIQYHLCCSAALLRYPKSMYDTARIGILQYGFFPSKETFVHYTTKKKVIKNPLARVLSWKTKVMDIKRVKTGEFIGYGTSFLANQPTKVAIIPVGYAEGFARNLSNAGKVIIREKRFNVIGMVNMNMMAVNVTASEDIVIGDEVVLIGSQGKQEIKVGAFGDYSKLINYELLTRLPKNIERIIVE